MNINENVEEFLRGDANAFGKLMNDYQDMLFSYIMSIVKDDTQSKDIFQDSILKIFNKIALFNPDKGEFKYWILKIAKNTAFDHLRKSGVSANSVEFQEEHIVEETEKSDVLLYQGIQHSIDKLSIEQAEVIELVYVQQMSYEQASDICSVKIGTLKSRIIRAKENLKKCVHLKKIWETYE